MSNPKIKSGNELDWDMVRKAANGILKAAYDVQFKAPDDLEGHMLYVSRVCQAMNSITDALKLRKTNKHEMTGTDSCDLMNSPHPHADGYVWVKCACGWKSQPIRGRDAATIFGTHVQQETTDALVEAAKHGKALSDAGE